MISMAFQDEQQEDAPVPLPLTTQEEPPTIGQVPQTPVPAPSEQFMFPEIPTTPQIGSAPSKPVPVVADEASTLTDKPAPEEPVLLGNEGEATLLNADAQSTPQSADEESTLSNAGAQPTLLSADGEQAPFMEYGAVPPPPYPAPGQTALPLQQQPLQRRRLDTTAIVAVCLTMLLVLLGSGGLIYDLAYYQPYQAQVNATATSNAQVNGTVNATNGSATSFAATDTAQQTATVQAYIDLYQQATVGQSVLNDTLNQQGNGDWDEYHTNDKSESCGFTNGSYHANQIQTGFFLPCYENENSFHDFASQVDMTIITGDDGGIVFRADSAKGTEYMLEINTSGHYRLFIYTGFSADQSQSILDDGTDYMNRSGPTTIMLIARGGTFYLYLNKHFVFSTTNTTLTSGLVGVVADAPHQSTDVAFNNAKVWLL